MGAYRSESSSGRTWPGGTGMTCEELRASCTLYALGILDDPERTEITEHLQRRCESCVPEIASALATVTAMAGAVKIVEAPRDLRRRIAGMVDRRGQAAYRTRPLVIAWGLSAALAMALIAVAVPFRS